jgi:dihydroorotase
MKKKLLKNGCVLDSTGKLVKKDILIEGKYIKQIDYPISLTDFETEVIDLNGKLISPGFIDMHVHLREPGFEEKETIETGTQAAAKGGFTTIACMPNTRPVIDSATIFKGVVQKAEQIGFARVLPFAAITVHEAGHQLTDMTTLKQAGVIGFSDDGVGVQNSRVMKDAMRIAHSLNLPIVAHCEDYTLSKGGCVHDGRFAARYHLKGIPSEAESIHVGRDILLAEDIGVHYHVCHISSEQSVRLVREAKARGQRVTAEVTPHHLLLCEEDILEPNPMFKMNPPLRSVRDHDALLVGLKDGTIDIIATDHAPHTLQEKANDIEMAPFGIVGLETAFPLLYTHLVLKGILTLAELIQKMSYKPAEIFDLPYGVLAKERIADVTIIDLEEERNIDPTTFLSKGRNTPFTGWKVKGWPVMTLMNGRVTFTEKEVQNWK